MDAELKENLAAMSCEFQDSDNDDYSPRPAAEDLDQRTGGSFDEKNTSSPSNIPLITEHIISVSDKEDSFIEIYTWRYKYW